METVIGQKGGIDMSKIVITKYKCDVCGEEFSDEKKIQTIKVPCCGETIEIVFTNIDVCKDCLLKMRNVIYDDFAEIVDSYGLHIKKKF